MIYRVEVFPAPGTVDARGSSLSRQAQALDIRTITGISVNDLYFLQGELDAAGAQEIAHALLYDPVIERVSVRLVATDGSPLGSVPTRTARTVEVMFRPGVTDSVAESLLQGAHITGQHRLSRAASGRRYVIAGQVTEADLRRLAEGLLANTVIQTYAVNRPIEPPFMPTQAADGTCEVIALAWAGDAQLLEISRERRLSLDLAEMCAIRDYYRREEREPTDVELEMLAQTWSEHCVHKTFRALISYEQTTADGTPAPGTQRTIDSLLKTYIRAATDRANRPWVHSAFVDNAGIVAFDEHTDLAFKVETHNHPSALEPFGGANTGVGGVVRDVIGVSARPIANTDVLCFGPHDLPFDRLPAGVLHPQRIADGVTAGVEDYGNKMGIPTVNGAILYDPGYTANPLVFCGCLGILPRGAHPAAAQSGDLVIVIGGRTGRDGLRGATFSSMEMDHQTGQLAGTAVQIGHPIHEKQVLEAVMIARDDKLYTAITDCGAGGLSSAVGEMASELGAEIHLERVPLKYPGLRPWEIWLSEAQERMVLAVPPAHWPRLQAVCAALDVEATDLGSFTGDGVVYLYYGEQEVGRISADFLHHGIPRRQLRATWTPPATHEPVSLSRTDFTADLLALLALPNIRSKEDVVRRYDHEVQGATVVKPFVGPQAIGPADAAVLHLDFASAGAQRATRLPTTLSFRGVAISSGVNPAYTALDPYAMAWAAVDEAFRNCVAVGADPEQVSLLDNFCWGNPTLPDRLGGLVRCAEGCYDAAVAYGAPFISGKDSLNNEYTGADGQKHAIPGTLLISALGIVPDVRRSVTSDLKHHGDLIYVVGLTGDELGGSAYYGLRAELGSNVPQPAAHARATFGALHAAIAQGLVQACHDCAEGGLAVAAAEMAIAGGLGLRLDLSAIPCTPDGLRVEAGAFSESLSRFVVEVAPEHASTFEARLAGVPFGRAGTVSDDQQVLIVNGTLGPAIAGSVAELEHAWRGHIR